MLLLLVLLSAALIVLLLSEIVRMIIGELSADLPSYTEEELELLNRSVDQSPGDTN